MQPENDVSQPDQFGKVREYGDVGPRIVSGGICDTKFGITACNTSSLDVTGLDALAILASSAADLPLSANASSSDEESMPPPPSRRYGRTRSASNPEGMEKWDSYGRFESSSSRRHFVLPTSILEEELESANRACQAKFAVVEDTVMVDSSSDAGDCYGESEESEAAGAKLMREELQFSGDLRSCSPSKCATSPSTVVTSVPNGSASGSSIASHTDAALRSSSSTPHDDSDSIEPCEILMRARSKLLEDLSTASVAEKGVLPLPHLLSKYKELYNRNGRIGIYTPAERAAIIAKFQSKRSRRVWNKKIRYNCRKNLADRRMRVKGRFVKRAVENGFSALPSVWAIVDKPGPTESQFSLEGSLPSASVPDQLIPVKEDSDDDFVNLDHAESSMPNVGDPEAGFEPTLKQPFRRTRRHTIT